MTHTARKGLITAFIGITAVGITTVGCASKVTDSGHSAAPPPKPASTSAPAAPVTPSSEAPSTSVAPAKPKPSTKPAPPAPKQASYTTSQEQAIGSAKDYLEYQAFSRNGLIEQLSSEYGEGFSKADAVFAVDHITVNWNEQAAKSAKSYLETQHFSRSGLIEQLSSEYGEGFTLAQATYGVNQAGL